MIIPITHRVVVNEVISWLKTPYAHQGRRKGVGVDCVGLIIGVANELELSDFQYNHGYQPLPDGVVLKEYMDKHLIQISKDQMQPGDIMLFWFSKKDVPQHVAFLVPENKMVHAYRSANLVTRHRMNTFWDERFMQAYKYHGLAD